jgi:hypothetical protein
MNTNFKIGEILIVHSLILSADLNGMECTVRGLMHFSGGISRETGLEFPPNWAYLVEMANGLLMRIPPQNLRRRPPTTGEKSILNMFTLPVLETV